MKTSRTIRRYVPMRHAGLFALAAAGGVSLSAVGCGAAPQADAEALSSGAIAKGHEYFVSGTGVDGGNTSGDRAHPFRTIQKAANLTVPGDTVTVLDGTYHNPRPGGGAILDITRSGTENAWITYRVAPGQHPKLKFDGWNGVIVHGGASYIEIRGFDIEGTIKDTDLAFCTTQAKVANPLCNGNGISVDGRSDGAKPPHHIRIVENEIHDCAGGGASAISADYITMDGNVVHDNSWYTRYATSGISILTPTSLDASTGYKMFVRGNRLWNNRTQVKWEKINDYSDGNGIIIDSFHGGHNSNGDYKGRTLVANNVSVKNGGSGIHSFASAHVDIVNNSAHKNGQIVGYSDIFASYSDDVRIFNNIMYARPEGQVNSNYSNTNVVYDYNVYFSGKAPAVVGTHDRITDPLFLDAENHDLRVRAGSPAIDTGTTALAPAADIVGVARPSGGGIDIGAYESTADAAPGALYEAELGTIGGYGGAMSGARSGYTGTGFFDFHYSTSASLTLAIPAETAGTSTLVLRYTNGAGVDRPLRVLVNGAEVAAALSFPQTASWWEWKTVSIKAPLNAGANTLRLEAGPNSGANIDSVRVER